MDNISHRIVSPSQTVIPVAGVSTDQPASVQSQDARIAQETEAAPTSHFDLQEMIHAELDGLSLSDDAHESATSLVRSYCTAYDHTLIEFAHVKLFFLDRLACTDHFRTALGQKLPGPARADPARIRACIEKLIRLIEQAPPTSRTHLANAFSAAAQVPAEIDDWSHEDKVTLLGFANTAHADMRGFKIGSAQICEINLSHTDLEQSIWQEVDLTDAQMDHCRLHQATLDGVNLTDTDLRGAHLTDLRGFRANMAGAILRGAHITLDPIWYQGEATTHEQTYQHLVSRLDISSKWSLLDSVESIDDCYGPLKRALLGQILEPFERIGMQERLAWDFMDTWMQLLSNDIYLDSEVIEDFAGQYTPLGLVSVWNDERMPADFSPERTIIFNHHLVEMLNDNCDAHLVQSAIHQLTLHAATTASRLQASDPQSTQASMLQSSSDRLRRAFLEHPDVRLIAKALDTILPGSAQDHFIFIDADRTCAIACTEDMVKAALADAAEVPWHAHYCFLRHLPTVDFYLASGMPTEMSLRTSALLHQKYLALSTIEQQRYADLFDALWQPVASSDGASASAIGAEGRSKAGSSPGIDIGATPAAPSSSAIKAIATPKAPDMATFRQLALTLSGQINTPSAAQKAISIDWQMFLNDCVQQVTQPAQARSTAQVRQSGADATARAASVVPRLKPEAADALWAVALAKNVPDTPAHRAAFEVVEAIKLTHLTSSSAMGTEMESPIALRTLARTLLYEAVQKHPDILPQNVLASWHKSLEGASVSSQCTDSLTAMMCGMIAQQPPGTPLVEMYETFFPVAWR